MDVHLGGGSLLHLEVGLHQEVSPLAHGTARHGRGEVQVGAGGQQTLQLLVFGLLQVTDCPLHRGQVRGSGGQVSCSVTRSLSNLILTFKTSFFFFIKFWKSTNDKFLP